jgi:type IV pilus assembly protein PilM
MGIPFLSKKKLVVGIDIGSHSVKICHLKQVADGYSIDALGSIVLPEGAVDDGTLNDPEVVGEAISSLIKNLKIKNKKIGFSISGYSVIVKKINLPIMEEAELEEHILAEAEQYIPFDIDDVYLDYQDLHTAKDASDKTDVMLVAAKKEIVDEYLEMFQDINLEPVVVDIDGFAFENSYERIHQKVGNVALIDIGASKMNINILSQGISVVARDIIVGSGQLTDQIQNIFDIDYDEAEKIKFGALAADEGQDEIAKIYTSTCTQWILEIKKAVDLYHANNPEQPLRGIVLGGGGSKVDGLAEFIAQETSLKVELFDPFVNIGSNDKKIDPEYLRIIGPDMAVAAGIALRVSEI